LDAANALLLLHSSFKSKFAQPHKATVRGVLKTYGDKTSHWLSDLTHREAPYRLRPNHTMALRAPMVSRALAGRLDQACGYWEADRIKYPTASIPEIRDIAAYWRDEGFTVFTKGFRLAGMPE
jgi:hypothetical protein